jgi:DnaJ-class molecular chaperone
MLGLNRSNVYYRPREASAEKRKQYEFYGEGRMNTLKGYPVGLIKNFDVYDSDNFYTLFSSFFGLDKGPPQNLTLSSAIAIRSQSSAKLSQKMNRR